MKNLLLILALFVVGCSETVPEPFIEFSMINEQLLCEGDYSEELGYYYTYTFKTNYLEEATEEVVEINYFERDKSGEFVLVEKYGDYPFRQVENLVEFSFEFIEQFADDEDLEIKETNYSVLVVINMKNLKGKETTSYKFVGKQESYDKEMQCKKF